MPAPTAVGGISKAEDTFRNMLANCTYFISWAGESNATDAKTHIYANALPAPSLEGDAYSLAGIRELRPFAIIWTSDTNGYRWHELQGPSGQIYVRLEQDIATSYVNSFANAERDFKNSIGRIIQSGDSSNPGLIELSRAAGYHHITQVELLELQRTSDEDRPTLGDAEAAILLVSWGVAE